MLKTKTERELRLRKKQGLARLKESRFMRDYYVDALARAREQARLLVNEVIPNLEKLCPLAEAKVTSLELHEAATAKTYGKELKIERIKAELKRLQRQLVEEKFH